MLWKFSVPRLKISGLVELYDALLAAVAGFRSREARHKPISGVRAREKADKSDHEGNITRPMRLTSSLQTITLYSRLC